MTSALPNPDRHRNAAPGQPGGRGDVLFFAVRGRLALAVAACGAALILPLVICAQAVLDLTRRGYGLPGPWFADPVGALPDLIPALAAALAAVLVARFAGYVAGLGRGGGFVAGVDGRSIHLADGRTIGREALTALVFLPGLALIATRSGGAGLVAVPTGLVAGGGRRVRRDLRTALCGENRAPSP